MLIPFEGKSPQIAANVFIAPTAVLIGDVHVEEGASIWFNAVLRGDFGTIVIGAGSCVQDNTTLHVPIDGRTVVGKNVTVGHGAMLEGCVVGDGAVVGMGSILLHGVQIGEQAMVAAGSVVPEQMQVPARMLAAGVPAKLKKELGGSALEWTRISAGAYHDLRSRYLAQGIGEPAAEG